MASLAELWGDAQIRVAQQLAAMVLFTSMVRTVLYRFVIALGLSTAVLSSTLVGLLTGGVLMAYRTSAQALQVNQMMDTQTNFSVRSVTWRIGGPQWQLCSFDFTLEESFGCTAALAQLTMFFFFETWGLRGPQACRWAAVVGHAGCAAILMFAAECMVSRHLASTSNSSVDVFWLFLTASNWCISSWAALTWWHSAVAASAAASSDEEEWPIPVHVMALAVVQLVNFWLCRRARQPELLSGCVVLAGISMACSCFVGQGEQGSASAASAKLWTPALYLGFCAMGVWVLWQELLRSLDM